MNSPSIEGASLQKDAWEDHQREESSNFVPFICGDVPRACHFVLIGTCMERRDDKLVIAGAGKGTVFQTGSRCDEE